MASLHGNSDPAGGDTGNSDLNAAVYVAAVSQNGIQEDANGAAVCSTGQAEPYVWPYEAFLQSINRTVEQMTGAGSTVDTAPASTETPEESVAALRAQDESAESSTGNLAAPEMQPLNFSLSGFDLAGVWNVPDGNSAISPSAPQGEQTFPSADLQPTHQQGLFPPAGNSTGLSGTQAQMPANDQPAPSVYQQSYNDMAAGSSDFSAPETQGQFGQPYISDSQAAPMSADSSSYPALHRQSSFSTALQSGLNGNQYQVASEAAGSSYSSTPEMMQGQSSAAMQPFPFGSQQAAAFMAAYGSSSWNQEINSAAPQPYLNGNQTQIAPMAPGDSPYPLLPMQDPFPAASPEPPMFNDGGSSAPAGYGPPPAMTAMGPPPLPHPQQQGRKRRAGSSAVAAPPARRQAVAGSSGAPALGPAGAGPYLTTTHGTPNRNPNVKGDRQGQTVGWPQAHKHHKSRCQPLSRKECVADCTLRQMWPRTWEKWNGQSFLVKDRANNDAEMRVNGFFVYEATKDRASWKIEGELDLQTGAVDPSVKKVYRADAELTPAS